MQKPLLGHLDPDLADILLEVVALLRVAYQAAGGLVLPLQSTGTSGMECGLANLLEPGDTAIVGVMRLLRPAHRRDRRAPRRQGGRGRRRLGRARVQRRAARGARPAPRRAPGCVVHAETSTGVEHPLAELGAALRDRDMLLMADCVTSLGGVELDFDGWGIDFAYSCTQKCLGAPPGMSPVAVSERALERIRGTRAPGPLRVRPAAARALLGRAPGRLPPHGADPPHLRAARGAARGRRRGARGPLAASHRGRPRPPGRRSARAASSCSPTPSHQLAPLTAVRVPEGVDGKAVQTACCVDHGIEIGGGLAGAPPIWRIGLMGDNADRAVADRVLDRARRGARRRAGLRHQRLKRRAVEGGRRRV